MRRLRRIALGSLLLVPAGIVALLLLAAGALEFSWGQEALRRILVQSGRIDLAAIDGSPLRRAALSGLRLRDGRGDWLAVRRITLAWDIRALVRRSLAVELLEIEGLELSRLPHAEAAATTTPAAALSLPSRLPLAIRLAALRLSNARIGAAVTGAEQTMQIDGEGAATFDRTARGMATFRAHLSGPGEGQALLRLRRDGGLSFGLSLVEPAGGFLAGLLGMPGLGAITAEAHAEGPPDAALLAATIETASGLHGELSGRLDLEGGSNALQLTLSATGHALDALAGQPLAIGAARLDGAITGTLEAPRARLNLTLDDIALPAPMAPLARVALEGDAALSSDGSLAIDAVQVSADTFTMSGSAELPANAPPRGTVRLAIPRLRAAAPGLGLTGGIAARIALAADGRIDLEADLQAIEGPGPITPLLGTDAKLAARLRLQDAAVVIESLTLEGQALALAAHGRAGAELDLSATLSLPLLAALAPTLDGSAEAELHLAGAAADPEARIGLRAPRIVVADLPPGTLQLAAHGRPFAARPEVEAEGRGSLAGQDLALSLRLLAEPDGSFGLPHASLQWGAMTLTADGRVLADHRPDLTARLILPSLALFGMLAGEPLSGSLTVAASIHPAAEGIGAMLNAEARALRLGDIRANHLTAHVSASGPLAAPVLDGAVEGAGVAVGRLLTGGRLTLKGPPDALAISARLDGSDHALSAEALAELPLRLRLATFSARWRGENLRLAAPASITFDPPAVDRLTLDLARGGRIEASGHAGAALDLAVSLRRLPLSLATIAAPDLALTGTLDGEAKLSGTPSAPTGTLRANVRGLGLAGMPKADATIAAQFAGGQMRADATLTSGSAARLVLTAEGPLAALATGRASLNGTLGLVLLDPLLAPDGRQARGTVRLALAAENQRLSGTARLSGGRFSDGLWGITLGGIEGTATAQGQVVRLDVAARTGGGRIGLTGELRPFDPEVPLALQLRAQAAQLAVGEMLSARFDAGLDARGSLQGSLDVSGRVEVARAEIKLPERMPPNVVELPVQVLGEPPPPPAPAAGAGHLVLDVAIRAPQAVFVRGQGLDAELGGALQLAGNPTDPRLSGELVLRNGTLDRLGQTFTFRRGRLDFDGGSGFDPTLDFEAERRVRDLTALIHVSGRPSALKIDLTSVPEAPSDEILARLLFGRSRGALSAGDGLQLARAAAELAGIGTPGGGMIDRLRSDLGLDRLSVGAGEDGKAGIEAGRYIADGVYLGARQRSDGSAQATIELEVLPGVALGADIGGQASDRVNVTIGVDY